MRRAMAMSESILGRLTPVAAREVWAHEGLHFIPWLLRHPFRRLSGWIWTSSEPNTPLATSAST